jgi:glutamate-1-semialdehyde 2,1-aminomutase
MQGSGGCIPARPEFLAMLRQEAEEAGAILIFDEVMTSRLGRGGAHTLLDLKPDLMTLGKWVGGGMTFGAFGGRADLMSRFDPSAPGALPHAGTFNNNVVTMAAGIAALSEAFTPEIAEALHARGDTLRARINALFAEHGLAMCATGIGSLMNLHPVPGPVTSRNDLDDAPDTVRELLFLDLLARGFYVARRGFIALSLAVTDDHLDRFITALGEIVEERKPLLPARA